MNKVVSKILAQLFFMFQHNQDNHRLSTPPIQSKNEEKSIKLSQKRNRPVNKNELQSELFKN